MKKAIKIGAFAFAGALLFTSCKKDWTCICNGEVNQVIKNQTKKKAKEICEGDVNFGVINVSGDNGCYLQ